VSSSFNSAASSIVDSFRPHHQPTCFDGTVRDEKVTQSASILSLTQRAVKTLPFSHRAGALCGHARRPLEAALGDDKKNQRSHSPAPPTCNEESTPGELYLPVTEL
jgi:hypothetical protein